jgi:hypothetical protein
MGNGRLTTPLPIPDFRFPISRFLLVVALACSGGGGEGGGGRAPDSARAAPPYTPTAGEQAFLDTLTRRTFDFFWETTDPRTGLAHDRWPTKSFSSVASVGYALTAYPVGVERGYVGREAARDRVLTTLRFFWNAPQGAARGGVSGYKGFYYHFLDFERGHRFAQVELSTIDTALLLGGALFCREYFDRPNDPAEAEIRALADSIYFRVDWRWAQDRQPTVSMGWRPDSAPHQDARGFITSRWQGYNEAMLLYVLALASPTHSIDASAWDAWTRSYRWERFQGEEFLQFAPLFGHQYSHVWVDFRGIRDRYMREKGSDYFENSRRAALSQHAYARANPGGWRGYDARSWGLTASDGPFDGALEIDGRRREFHTYWARGAGADELNDDGTIAPTAAGGSVPFAPEIAIPALVAMRTRHGDALFGRYGFIDAFNPTLREPGPKLQHGRIVAGQGWFDTDYLGIDQGPILAMVENYRTDLVWRYMRRSPHVVQGLCRAGFSGGWLEGKC